MAGWQAGSDRAQVGPLCAPRAAVPTQRVVLHLAQQPEGYVTTPMGNRLTPR